MNEYTSRALVYSRFGSPSGNWLPRWSVETSEGATGKSELASVEVGDALGRLARLGRTGEETPGGKQMINVKFDTRELDKARKMLSAYPGAFQKAQSDAVNRALLAARTALAKGIRERYVITGAEVKAQTVMKRATPVRAEGELEIRGTPLPLEQGASFSVTTAAAQTWATIIRGARKVIQGAWIDARGKVTKREGPERYPIKRVHTLSVANMAAVPPVIDPVMERTYEVMNARLRHNVLRYLSK